MRQRLASVSAVVALVSLLAVGGCQTTAASSARATDPGDTQRQISALLDQYTTALMKKDTVALDRIWADDLSFINLRGELLTKQQRMENIRTGATAFKSIQLSEVRVRPSGDTAAVATCRVDLEAQYSGQEGSGSYRVTTAWARPRGDWQMVAVQMTRIEQ